jgi:glycosyltransferase involved in cell wall biosynthesis
LENAIIRLDDDRQTLAVLAERGRQRVLEHYTVKRLAQDFTGIYASVGKND